MSVLIWSVLVTSLAFIVVHSFRRIFDKYELWPNVGDEAVVIISI